MANHKSALKRVRSSAKKQALNSYQHKSARTAIRKLRAMTSKQDAEKFMPKVVSMVDKLAKKNIIHDNKAANLKSKLAKHVATLS